MSKYKYKSSDIHTSDAFNLKLYVSRDVLREYKKEKETVDKLSGIRKVFELIATKDIPDYFSLCNEIKDTDLVEIFMRYGFVFKEYYKAKPVTCSGGLDAAEWKLAYEKEHRQVEVLMKLNNELKQDIIELKSICLDRSVQICELARELDPDAYEMQIKEFYWTT